MPSKPKLIRSKKFVGLPPKSTNSLYDKSENGFWYKTFAYRLFRKAMLGLLEKDGFLPKADKDWQGRGLYIEVGIIKEFDLDNTLKGIIDALQETYEFNDNCINGIIAKKNVVGEFPLTKAEWDTQYILIGFIEYDNLDCDIYEPSDFVGTDSAEIQIPKQITDVLFRSVTEDWTNVENSAATDRAVYPLNLYPDLEEAAKKLNLDVSKLAQAMKEIGPNYRLEAQLLTKFENNSLKWWQLKNALSNKVKKDEFDKLMESLGAENFQIKTK